MTTYGFPVYTKLLSFRYWKTNGFPRNGFKVINKLTKEERKMVDSIAISVGPNAAEALESLILTTKKAEKSIKSFKAGA